MFIFKGIQLKTNILNRTNLIILKIEKHNTYHQLVWYKGYICMLDSQS